MQLCYHSGVNTDLGIAACTRPAQAAGLESRRPLQKLVDVYKLAYQSSAIWLT